MKSILSSAKKLAVIAGFLVAGAANAATFDVLGNKLAINGPANVTYTVQSAYAGNTNVFLYNNGSWLQMALGQSVTLYNVAAGALNFGFFTETAASTATDDFLGFGNAVYNGSEQIKWAPSTTTVNGVVKVNSQDITGLSRIVLGFEDIKLPGGDKDYNDLIVSASVSAVPLPGAALLFASSLLGFMGASRRRKV